MTGYGRSEVKTPTGSVLIDIKTTNHRYLDLSTRLPYYFQSYEESIRKNVKQHVKRGKVHLTINAPEVLLRKNKLLVNEALAKEYYKAFQKLSKTLGIKDKIQLNQISRMPDVITSTSSLVERDLLWKKINTGINQALKSLSQSRLSEGRHLKTDLSKRSKAMVKNLRAIKQHLPKANKVTEKDNDITEEIVRLQSHFLTLEKTLRSGTEIGKKLDFLAQEIMREANTIGAKCNSVVIANQVIEIKTELEKVREQAQNLE